MVQRRPQLGEYCLETLKYLNESDPDYRKRLGQFFTPRRLREELLFKLPRLVKPKVLDPSCGTGEFLLSAKEYFVEPKLYGWEIDPKLVRIARQMVPDAYIEHADSLQKPFKEEFDVVLGNPPYFEFKLNKKLKRLFNGSVTLHELGYKVQTGKVVWNQNRDRLTDDPDRGIPLIWAHNIVKGRLVLSNKPGKPQYVKSNNYDTGPAIVARRVIGHPRRSGGIEAALVPPGFKFLGENHVNVIYPPEEASLEELEEIVKQLNSSEAQQAVKLITGNTQISKTELEKLFPIKLKDPLRMPHRRCL